VVRGRGISWLEVFREWSEAREKLMASGVAVW
jgi:hypothetical protein